MLASEKKWNSISCPVCFQVSCLCGNKEVYMQEDDEDEFELEDGSDLEDVEEDEDDEEEEDDFDDEIWDDEDDE